MVSVAERRGVSTSQPTALGRVWRTQLGHSTGRRVQLHAMAVGWLSDWLVGGFLNEEQPVAVVSRFGLAVRRHCKPTDVGSNPPGFSSLFQHGGSGTLWLCHSLLMNHYRAARVCVVNFVL